MNLEILGQYPSSFDPQLEKIRAFAGKHDLSLKLEWKGEQFWLHSDDQKERPFGILIDQELERHEDYFKRSSIHKELLARAVGVKSGTRPQVLDLTGGLLGDTLLLLSFGCEVKTLERHPVISLLIESALKKAKHSALSRLTFIPTDAQTYLAQKPEVDVIYFDPMFEDPNEKTKPKKEMRIFRSVVGGDQDALKVFELARELRPKRLVVKRPRLSIPLSAGPDIVYEGKSTRYDVYLGQNHGTFSSNPLK